jgi:SAM-dependent methyltransferase
MTFKPPHQGSTLNETYDETFFRQHDSARPAYAHLAQLIREISPADAQSVVDVGCGHCILLQELAKYFSSAHGIDGSQQGIPASMRDKVSVVDMSQHGWRERVETKADVVVSLETAEHLPEESSEKFIEGLLAHTPSLIVFSAATPYQDLGKNPGHLNEKPLTYWVEKFESRGYALSTPLSIKLRSAMTNSTLYAGVAWYPKNILAFTPGQRDALIFSAQEFMYSSDPTFQLIFERDRLEFENLILKRIKRRE